MTMRVKQIFLSLLLIAVLLFIYIRLTDVVNIQKVPSSPIILIKNELETTTKKFANVSKEKNETDMKYILLWTSPNRVPFQYMGIGQKGFIDRKCPYTNCFVTGDRNYFDTYTKFDVIAFAGPEVIYYRKESLPVKRSPHQKYAFATIESADNYPICSNKLDGFFNWTWTFKLDSQVRWGYFSIRDKYNKIIGPNKIMHWIKPEDMDPVSDEFKKGLKSKTKAAAWFVSNCSSRNKRQVFVRELQEELKRYDLLIDIYGDCGTLQCSRANEEKCDTMIKETYYFYLSFENSFSEDYVTEKLLHALVYNAVPIVYGGANYTRFMPDGAYLNARELGVKNLAMKMNELINNLEMYKDYFKWKNHYSYHWKSESVDTNEYCLFCTTLNNEDMVKETSIYQSFREWWDPPDRC